MADLGLATAISVTQSGRQVLATAAFANGRIPSLKLPESLKLGRFAEARVVLGAPDAKKALTIAIVAGHGIISALKALKSSARLAGHEPLVSSMTKLEIGGTRISHLNLNVVLNRVIGLIDKLVDASEYKNANFISSDGPNIVVKTSRFGGSIRISPQPLDSAGLDLKSLSLMTTVGADDALARLDDAINQAYLRVERLESLQRAVSSSTFSSQSLSAILAYTQASALPRGSLVNLFG